MRFLSDEWLDAVVDRAGDPVAGGFSGEIGWVVGAGPDGEVRLRVDYEDGRPSAADREQPGDDAVVLTLPYRDAVAAARGEVDLNARFMQGEMKVAGPTGPLLEFLKTSQSEPFVARRDALADDTEF